MRDAIYIIGGQWVAFGLGIFAGWDACKARKSNDS